MQIITTLLPQVNRLANRCLQYDPESLAELAKHAGKVLQINIGDAPHTIFVILTIKGVQLAANHDQPVNAVISGSLSTFINLIRRNSQQHLQNELSISGDMELAQEVKAILTHLQIDWEEPLSHVLGDSLAHTVMYQARQVGGWLQRVRQRFGEDMKDYLQDERRYLVARDEVETFSQAVTDTRHAVERIAVRMNQLAIRVKHIQKEESR